MICYFAMLQNVDKKMSVKTIHASPMENEILELYLPCARHSEAIPGIA